MVEAVSYFVADGVLRLCDEHGKPGGGEYLMQPDDDAHAVAGRLAREKTSTPDINRRLKYPNMGIA
jgi:hypothetical protein